MVWLLNPLTYLVCTVKDSWNSHNCTVIYANDLASEATIKM